MGKHIMLRRDGMGLETLRHVRLGTSNPSRLLIRNDMARNIPDGDGTKFLFNWGYTRVNDLNYKILNTPQAVGLASNKGGFRVALFDNGLTMPSYSGSTDDLKEKVTEGIVRRVGYILRPKNHMGGSPLYHITENTTFTDIFDKIDEYGDGAYLSEYIEKDKEFRVVIMQNRVLFVVEKIPDTTDTIAWNVANGGRFENVRFGDWNLKALDYAIKAHKLAGLDYSAVDVITKGDEVYVLEVNTAPQILEEYWGACFSKGIDYLIDNNNEMNLEVSTEYTDNWRYYVHPAINHNARLAGLAATDTTTTTTEIPNTLDYQHIDSVDTWYDEDIVDEIDNTIDNDNPAAIADIMADFDERFHFDGLFSFSDVDDEVDANVRRRMSEISNMTVSEKIAHMLTVIEEINTSLASIMEDLND